MSKKMGLADGMIVGGGFFLGYFLAKWLVAFLIIATVVWGMCSIAARNDAKGRTDIITHKLLSIGDYSGAPMLTFTRNCPLRSSPKLDAPVTDFTIAGNTYRVIGKRNGWKHIVTFGANTGWTKCPTELPGRKNKAQTIKPQTARNKPVQKLAFVEPKVVVVKCDDQPLAVK